jgi:hypothetical protein
VDSSWDRDHFDNAVRARKRRKVESALDLTQMRLPFFLFFSSIFLSITLFCLRVDGVLDATVISLWGCALPLLICIGYFALSAVVTKQLYLQQFRSSHQASHFSSLWVHFESSPKSLLFDEQRQKLTGFWLLLLILLLGAAQVVLVGLKLSDGLSHGSGGGASAWPWACVFVPLWALFLLYCAAPVVYAFVDFAQRRFDITIFIAGKYVLLVLYCFVLFCLLVCLVWFVWFACLFENGNMVLFLL